MPTPHGTRGGMAFSADEVRVVRRALAEVLHPSRIAAAVVAPRPAEYGTPAAYVSTAEHVFPAEHAFPVEYARPAAYVQDYLRLAEAVEEAVHEAGRLRAFLLDELRRYRQALPGAAAGYLERLTTALAGGYLPGAEDLAALRLLRSLPCGAPEYRRRTAVLRRCETLAENDVRLRLEAHMPAPRRLLTLPGLTDEPKPDQQPPAQQPPAQPGKDKPAAPAPPRRTPTPAEIWPPHRRPTPKPDQARSA